MFVLACREGSVGRLCHLLTRTQILHVHLALSGIVPMICHILCVLLGMRAVEKVKSFLGFT